MLALQHLIVREDYYVQRFIVSLPPAYARENGPWPVLCFLHGRGEAAPMDIRQALTQHGPLGPQSSQQATDRFIVVGPQLAPPGEDVWVSQAGPVQQIVKKVQADYNGDPARTYLTGFSYGGNGVLDISSCHRNFWAALWPVDATRAFNLGLQRPVWLWYGEACRGANEDTTRNLNLHSAAAIPAGDYLSTDTRLPHVATATSAYRDDRVYDWLLTKHL